ncbi:MAG: GNAT family N-acetyltransferase [Thermoplasmata archaeon]|jgi:ribosomal protein S18 acetylase RimI-like enzyme|nr:GNAT family N-acetyltransferase [Thermoplasmata archaeon]
MSGDVRIRRIAPDQIDHLVAAQNEIFSDYVIPMRVTTQYFLEFLRSVGGKISNVHVATDGARIVGYVNPVVDGRESWVGGIGVIPDYRNNGIGARLMEVAEEFSKAEGAEEISLEYILGNERAERLYRRLGYKERRVYISAEGRPESFAGFGEMPEKATLADILTLHERAYGDTCWQKRKAFSIIQSARGADCHKVDGGFVLVRKLDANGYIPYLGVVPERRRQGIATSLTKFALNRLHELGAYKVIIYNVNDDAQTLRLLDQFGFGVTMKQVEMGKAL